MSNVSSEGSQKEIRGGQGADLLLTYDYGRTANIEIQDALASMSSLQYLWGGTLVESGITYHAKLETTLVDATDITLTNAVEGSTAKVINKTTPGTADHTITGGVVENSLNEVGTAGDVVIGPNINEIIRTAASGTLAKGEEYTMMRANTRFNPR